LRAKRSKLVVKNIKHFEIAASQKSLLAMTIQDFFSKLNWRSLQQLRVSFDPQGCCLYSDRSLTVQQAPRGALNSGFKSPKPRARFIEKYFHHLSKSVLYCIQDMIYPGYELEVRRTDAPREIRVAGRHLWEP
jgi:hypothetical protein